MKQNNSGNTGIVKTLPVGWQRMLCKGFMESLRWYWLHFFGSTVCVVVFACCFLDAMQLELWRANLCQDVEAMLSGLLLLQHVTDVGNDVTVVAAAASSTTLSRDVRLWAWSVTWPMDASAETCTLSAERLETDQGALQLARDHRGSAVSYNNSQLLYFLIGYQ